MLSVQQFLSKLATSQNLNDQSSEFQAAFDMWQNTPHLPDATKWAFENLWYDHNTPTNDNIKSRLIERERFFCQSSLVSEILKKNDADLFTWDDLFGGESYNVELSSGWWEGNESEREAKVEELREVLENTEMQFNKTFNEKMTITQRLREKSELKQKFNAVESDISLLENADAEFPDVLEWWLCSSWMIEKLKEQGEAILETDFGNWWGRQTSGQAISCDGVISKIAFDMGILEYQENEWSKK